jgi:predicted nucleotidyltransferase
MTDRDLEIARELKRRCSERVPLVEMRAFGSRVRGDNAIDSDLDIFVEVERLDRTIRRLIQDTAWEMGLDCSLVITPIVFSRDEIERSPIRSSPIVQAVREEGIKI